MIQLSKLETQVVLLLQDAQDAYEYSIQELASIINQSQSDVAMCLLDLQEKSIPIVEIKKNHYVIAKNDDELYRLKKELNFKIMLLESEYDVLIKATKFDAWLDKYELDDSLNE